MERSPRMPTKRRAADGDGLVTQQDTDSLLPRNRRATSSESVSVYSPSSSPGTDGSYNLSSPRPGIATDSASETPRGRREISVADPVRSGNVDSTDAQFSEPNYAHTAAYSAARSLPSIRTGREVAPVAHMASDPTHGASSGVSESLFFPMNEDMTRQEVFGEADSVNKDTVSAENWTKYKAVYKELLAQDRATSKLLNQMNNEHHNAIERARKVASRRNNRIEQLERENATLRGKISGNANGAPSSTEWERKFNTSQQALQMLTDDCNSWQSKYQKLQRELDSTIVRASAAERDTKAAEEQLEACNKELKEAKKGLKNGSAQLKDLQHILMRTDDIIVNRVRELSSVNNLWDENGNERLKTKVADQVTAMVDAWKRFEAEYEDAVGGTD